MEEQILKEIHGVFNGKEMVSYDDRIYPVPPNYASVTKLVEGDELNFVISNITGSYYKQCVKVPRKICTGMAVERDGSLMIESEGNYYKVLRATMTYYDIQEGDEVFIVIPKEGISEWAAVEAVIK